MVYPPTLEADEAALRAVLAETCKQHSGIADFRAKLLALLPIASSVGIFLLVRDQADMDNEYLTPVGVFGFVVTLGLFIYEVRGIDSCQQLREVAQRLEYYLKIPNDARPFGAHESGKLRGLVGAETAGWIVYPAVMAAWLYVATVPLHDSRQSKIWSATLALAVLIAPLAINGSIRVMKAGKSTQHETTSAAAQEEYSG